MRLFGREFTLFRTASNSAAVEQRSQTTGVLWGELPTGGNLSGVFVTNNKALSVPAIWAAVDTISKTLASLPFGLYEKTDIGAKAADGHPVAPLLSLEPSPLYSSFEFRRTLFANACFGDAYARIKRNGIGRAVEMTIYAKENVTVWQRPTTGEVLYIMTNLDGTQDVVFPSDVIHLKGLTLDGIQGLGVKTIFNETIGGAVASQDFGSAYFGNSAQSSGAIVYPNPLSKEQREMAEKKIQEKHGGYRNAGKIMVLDAGVKYEQMSATLKDAGLIEYRNMVINDTARVFGIPAHLLQQLDRATFNNIETMNVQFVTLCLRPWAVQAEQEFARKLLTADEKRNGKYFVRFNLDGLLRGDTQSRAAYYNTMFNIGAMSPNDIRELENFNRREGGDEYFVPLNMQGSETEEIAEPKTDQTPTQDTNNEENGNTQ